VKIEIEVGDCEATTYEEGSVYAFENWNFEELLSLLNQIAEIESMNNEIYFRHGMIKLFLDLLYCGSNLLSSLFFCSFCRISQPLCVQIKKVLEKKDFKVWIDLGN
jgi:hypothetical protein